MVGIEHLRGNKIINILGNFLYADTLEPTANNERPCGHCGENFDADGHDGCLGIMPGVMNACCGHGDEDQAYVQLKRYKIIEGAEAIG